MRKRKGRGYVWLVAALAAGLVTPAVPAQQAGESPGAVVECANFVYAGNKTSRCFSDKFLSFLKTASTIDVNAKFQQVRMGDEELFSYPFGIMTGEGNFTLTEAERQNLRSYLERGGFLLASAGCSDRNWDRSFRQEIQRIFPEYSLQKFGPEHPMFHTVYDIHNIVAKGGSEQYVEGLEINGKIVMVYSHLGLNDTGTVSGCCCCGGNEIRNAKEINVNIFAYALTH